MDAVREEQAGIAVLEGVMGYYDGLGGTETSASSWEIAEITDTPAIRCWTVRAHRCRRQQLHLDFTFPGKKPYCRSDFEPGFFDVL